MATPATHLYDQMERATVRAEAMLRAGLPPHRAGQSLVEGYADPVLDHIRFVVNHTSELEQLWPHAREYKRLLVSDGTHPGDLHDLAGDLLETLRFARGHRTLRDPLPCQQTPERAALDEIEPTLPGVVATLLLTQRGIRPIDIAEAKEREGHRTSIAAIGETVRTEMNVPAPSLWTRLTQSKDTQMNAILDAARSNALDPASMALLAEARRRDRAREAPAQLEAMQWVEAHLPGTTGVLSLSAAIGRYSRLEAFQDSIRRITADEQRYARALGTATTDFTLHRRGLGDVALAAAYHRVTAHGDPFAVFDETTRTAGLEHAQPIAFAIELAATRRIQRLLVEQVVVRGAVRDVGIGSGLDPRIQDRLFKAWAKNELVEEVQHHRDRLGAADPEAIRIEEVASRLFEASLLLHAIAELRPVAAGHRATPEARWAQRAIAQQVFEEQDPRDPPRTADAEIIPWQTLLARHPAVGTAQAASEVSTAFASLPAATSSAL